MLKIFWDDQEQPSVLAPLGDFFCIGHSIPGNISSLPITVSCKPEERHRFGGSAALNCYFPMPFQHPYGRAAGEILIQMATIKDVAELAGVSFKTVSRVINRSPHVRDEIRQRVLRAADTLEYRPHLHARHMRTQRSKVFAFISDDIATTPFAGQIIQGAQVAAWRQKMLLLMFHTGGDPAVEEAGVEAALERGVEGIIFATMYHRAVQVPKNAFRLPLVLVDCFTRDGSVGSVVPDEVNGGFSATKLLLEKGHRRIAMINADQKYRAASGRLQG